jgi:aryl-alcohol dehydrogenase-like predicted oxidoreductase
VHPRPLGSTGLTVTPVGLGLAALGRPAYIDLGRPADLGPDRGIEALERRCHEVLDAAYAAGIRYLDAARSYGRAEEFLASWLRKRGLVPSDLTIGSKWGYTYVGDWRMDAETQEVKDHSLAALTRQTAETRTLLGDHLDLYQIHSATLDSGVLEDQAVLAELTRLHEEGLVIGLSSSGPAQAATIRRALELTTAGAVPFACVQATWNLLEPSAGPALAEAGSAGWGVIIKEAVANGRLTPTATARRRTPSSGSRPTTTSAWTPSPWPPSWPTPGPTSSSPAPSPPPSCSPTSPPPSYSSSRRSWRS